MKIIGIIILALMIIAAICMQMLSILDIKDDIKKEETHKARIQALIIADRHYKNMIRNTTYRVHQKLVIMDESKHYGR